MQLRVGPRVCFPYSTTDKTEDWGCDRHGAEEETLHFSDSSLIWVIRTPDRGPSEFSWASLSSVEQICYRFWHSVLVPQDGSDGGTGHAWLVSNGHHWSSTTLNFPSTSVVQCVLFVVTLAVHFVCLRAVMSKKHKIKSRTRGKWGNQELWEARCVEAAAG
jgi:hypothetical protein